MELNDFIEHFAAQFDETDRGEFNETTIFRDLDEWSSLLALSVIAMVDDVYSITISGQDIRNSSTIGDLFKVLQDKKV